MRGEEEIEAAYARLGIKREVIEGVLDVLATNGVDSLDAVKYFALLTGFAIDMSADGPDTKRAMVDKVTEVISGNKTPWGLQ